MKKCEIFEDLQAFGIESIHEKTHISRDKIELLLAKSYGEINKIQFMGFISILEREYGIDLSDIKEEYSRFRAEYDKMESPKRSVILQASTNPKQKWVISGAILIVLLLIGGYYIQTSLSNEPRDEVIELNTLLAQPLNDINDTNGSVNSEMNQTSDTNITTAVSETNTTTTANTTMVLGENDLIIRPVYKVWAGLIDMASKEKTQKITDEPITIDRKKNWLIVLGHGRVEITSSTGKNVLKESGTVWFACENGILKQLTKDEFIERNGGANW